MRTYPAAAAGSASHAIMAFLRVCYRYEERTTVATSLGRQDNLARWAA
jgi:hypothetical protein